jgi:hypothetical protein
VEREQGRKADASAVVQGERRVSGFVKMEYVMKDLGYKRTPTKALFRVEMDKEIIGDV